jgi:hypothetical protein
VLVRAPEPLAGLRVVARPAALDAVVTPDGGTILRIATDDAIITGTAVLSVDDPYAIVEPEYAFVHWRLTPAEFEAIKRHIEWPLPSAGELGQGLIAYVPAKIMIASDHVLLIVSASLADDLAERLW